MLADSHYTLEAGMVLSVEPPVYLAEEKLGARVIDNVLVTATGCEVLSRHPLELCVVGG
jgi:Xaa-Pro dipeptidase